MKIDIPQAWCTRMAQLETDGEIGAGTLAFDPVFDAQAVPADVPEEASFAFSRFVRLARRHRGLTVETLAERADVEIAELVTIEEDIKYKPDLRTVYQLANFFGVQRNSL